MSTIQEKLKKYKISEEFYLKEKETLTNLDYSEQQANIAAHHGGSLNLARNLPTIQQPYSPPECLTKTVVSKKRRATIKTKPKESGLEDHNID